MSGEFSPLYWPRAILHVDMNAFFASVEQRDFYSLRGKPVAVTNGKVGSCIITCSYEARRCGVKTGMRLRDARRLCPEIIQRPARPEVYARTSTVIMQALLDVTPDVEVFSVDEAFLDVTRCQSLHGTPLRMARLARQKVFAASGLTCSIGVSGDKTTAKYASDLKKPDAITVIPPWETEARLADVPVTELCGIAEGVGGYLAQHGVFVCGDMKRLPVDVLARRWGAIGIRIWLMAQGKDPEKIKLDVPPPKSVGHGKVVPPGTTDRDVLLIYLQHMSENVGARLRRHDLMAQHYLIGLNTRLGWLAEKKKTVGPGNDGKDIFHLARFALETMWHGEPVGQVQVTALDPRPADSQLDLFNPPDMKRQRLNAVADQVNRKYGEFTLAPAPLLNRSTMPNVIAPGWRPAGHRQTI